MSRQQSNEIISYDTKLDAITPAEYWSFQEAYDFFNAELFGGSLPDVLVTLQRHAKAYGYFSPERFTGQGRARRTTRHEPRSLRTYRRADPFHVGA